jgi:hypothetical protein
VVARPGQGREPWYLLTNERILPAEDAWQIVFAYARRWQVEMSLRYDKCELAFESPRLQTWERQFKLLHIVALAHAFFTQTRPFAGGGLVVATLLPQDRQVAPGGPDATVSLADGS